MVKTKPQPKVYEVDKIVSRKKVGKVFYYRIRWKGFTKSRDTWEPRYHIANKLVDDYDSQCRDYETRQTIKKKEKPQQRKTYFIKDKKVFFLSKQSIEVEIKLTDKSEEQIINDFMKSLKKYNLLQFSTILVSV